MCALAKHKQTLCPDNFYTCLRRCSNPRCHPPWIDTWMFVDLGIVLNMSLFVWWNTQLANVLSVQPIISRQTSAASIQSFIWIKLHFSLFTCWVSVNIELMPLISHSVILKVVVIVNFYWDVYYGRPILQRRLLFLIFT